MQISVNRPRFVVMRREQDLTTVVTEHPTATEAEEYIEAMGKSGRHVDLYVVDRSKNVLADSTSETEAKKLAEALDLEAKRKALMDIQEENLARAEELKSRQVALDTSK